MKVLETLEVDAEQIEELTLTLNSITQTLSLFTDKSLKSIKV